MPRVSVVIITQNEAPNIEAALASTAWADERLVVDAESTDDTVARAQQAGARVIVRSWPGYSAQKNFAAGEAAHDWILSLDADERISDPLAREVQALLGSGPPAANGYRMPRVTRYLGRWVRSTDWYPDLQLRLYDRRRGSWIERRVHESVRVEGATGRLSGELLHHAYRDISHHLQTIDRYTSLAAEQMFAEGRRCGAWRLVIHPPAAFARNLIIRGGLRDGAVGFVVSAMNAYYVFLKLAKLWERQRSAGDTAGNSRSPHDVTRAAPG